MILPERYIGRDVPIRAIAIICGHSLKGVPSLDRRVLFKPAASCCQPSSPTLPPTVPFLVKGQIETRLNVWGLTNHRTNPTNHSRTNPTNNHRTNPTKPAGKNQKPHRWSSPQVGSLRERERLMGPNLHFLKVLMYLNTYLNTYLNRDHLAFSI